MTLPVLVTGDYLENFYQFGSPHQSANPSAASLFHKETIMSNQNFPAKAIFSTNYSVRIFTDENQNPWFCHKDICDVLGYKNSRTALSNHCKKKGVIKREILIDSTSKAAVLKQDSCSKTDSGKHETPSEYTKSQRITFINEGNLYRLIVKSKKPEAEKFEEWLFEEVLPQLRKTGCYTVDGQTVEPEKKTISAEQLRRLRDAIIDCTRYLKHYTQSMAQTLYPQMKAKFAYDKIENMPAEQFTAAMEWIQNHQPICHQLYNMTNYLEKEFIKQIKQGNYTDMDDIPKNILSTCQAPLLETAA